MTDRPRILVVDDEPQLTRVLRTGLTSRGYDVRAAADGLTGFETFNDWHPDLVITDLAMPNVDGLELCRRLRAISQVPIIVLSAKGEEKTKVEALDLGADDYVTKPFGINELLARIRTALRHAGRPDGADADSCFTFGEVRVDMARRLVFVANKEIHLTAIEYKLLSTLVRHAGKVVTHRQLLKEVWGPLHVEEGHYLRVYMRQLRNKLESTPANPKYLVTELGVGYRLRTE